MLFTNSRVAGRRRTTTAALAATSLVAVCGLAVLVSGAEGASASSSADLSLSQSISGSSTSGATIDTVTVHNAGSAEAKNIVLSLFLTSKSSGYYIHSSAGECSIAPAPSGFLAFASCFFPSLNSGSTLHDTITYEGTAGLAFGSFATVGAQTTDPSLKNNASTVASYFGPRADLALGVTAPSVTKKGTATLVSTVTNHGPNTANALQEIVEIKSAGFSSVHITGNISSSCQFIPAASGYTQAVACTTDSLGTGSKWIETFAYTGTASGKLATKTTVSANNPIDPVTTNNVASKSTTYHK